MDVTGLIAKVNRLVPGNHASDEEVVVLLNDAGLIIAEKVRLPSLAMGSSTIATVVGAHKASLPSTYHHWPQMCLLGSTIVNIRDNYDELLTINGGNMAQAGDVTDVAIQGNQIAYSPIPAVTADLTLHHSTIPTPLDDGTPTGTPSYLPTRFHKTLCEYAASILHDEIETGEEGNKPNTIKHMNEFEKQIQEIAIFYGQDKTSNVVKS